MSSAHPPQPKSAAQYWPVQTFERNGVPPDRADLMRLVRAAVQQLSAEVFAEHHTKNADEMDADGVEDEAIRGLLSLIPAVLDALASPPAVIPTGMRHAWLAIQEMRAPCGASARSEAMAYSDVVLYVNACVERNSAVDGVTLQALVKTHAFSREVLCSASADLVCSLDAVSREFRRIDCAL